MEKNEIDSWEYWEEEFRGMSPEQIEEYWKNEMESAQDAGDGILMDIADGMTPGFRAGLVKERYEKYKKAKAQHDDAEMER